MREIPRVLPQWSHDMSNAQGRTTRVRNRFGRAALALALASSAALALCASAGARAEALTLEAALALAEQGSPRLRAADAYTGQARSSLTVAGQYPNPDIELAAGNSRARVPGALPGSTQTIGISQPLDLPGVREPRRRAAEAGVTASEHARDDVRISVYAEIRQAFFEVLRRRAELEVAEDTVKLLEQVRDSVAARVRVGEAPRLELLRSESEALVAASAAERARLRVEQGTADLRQAIGAPLPARIEPIEKTGRPDPLPASPDLAAMRAQMLARHPGLAQARAQVEQARRRLDTERALRTPQPVFRAGVDQDPELRQWRIGISVPLPLWNRREGQIGEGIAALTIAEQALDQRRIELEAALESNYSRHRIATRQISALQSVVTQAEASLRVAQAAYRFGERGILEVIDAQRTLRIVRLDYLNARYDQQSAWIELERLRASDLKSKENP
jgi:cobalt-zinc-cadmium efflux system outer membrane protein